MEKREKWLSCIAAMLAMVMGSINTQAQSFGLLHSFTNSVTDGSTPEGQPLLIGSTLYGVTFYGGSNAVGTVYQVSTSGTGFNLIYSFLGATNGANPFCTLASTGSMLYGMTFNGGVSDGGIIFSVATNGTSYKVLHTFLGGSSDGLYPLGSVIVNGTNLYGMTTSGGTNEDGVIFGINTNGTSLSVLHSFSGSVNDGSFPNEGVVASGSVLYGTTFEGGSNGLGIVFAMDTATTNNPFRILHHFNGGTLDGANATGPLTLSGSTLYGVTTDGGSNSLGVIFKVSTNGTGYTVLHQFTGGANDGANPQFGPLVVTNTVIYGTTEEGGPINAGVLFQMNTDGSGFSLLHSFSTNANDGAFPSFGPTFNGSFLYGVTVNGGSTNLGVVYGAPITNAPSQIMCTNVFASANGGVVIGSVNAGQSYSYSASGCVAVNSDGFFSNPDGVQFFPNCSTFFTNPAAATAGSTCPGAGFIRFSLVGKVGGNCIQLGTSGSFVAPASGPLVLYLNDDNYFDNSGFFTACITPIPQMCANVPATNEAGVAIGVITAGTPYTFSATGTASYECATGNFVDANGDPWGPLFGPIGWTCPSLGGLSLVGKVNGTCVQLGTSGTFVAPDSGTLTLFMNDTPGGFFNNCGSWNVCISPLICSSTSTAILTQVSAIQLTNNSLVITVPSVICEAYQLQYSDEMVPTNWVDIIGASQQGTGGSIQFTQPITGCLPPGACVAPPSGLVSWWAGDGNAQDLVSGNTGMLVNGATFTAGEVCQAFSFTTNHAAVAVGNPASLQLQTFTIETWFRLHSITQLSNDPTCGNGVLFSYGTGGYGFIINHPGGNFLCLTQIDSTFVQAGPNINDISWHHGAVTKSGSNVVFYLDGTAYPAPSYSAIFQFTTPAAIGIRGDNFASGTNACAFNGDIDEVSIYNRALSPSEITSIYNAGAAGKCKSVGPHRFYRVDESP